MLSFLKADRNKILVDNLIYNLVSYSKIIALYQERYPHILFLSQETVWSQVLVILILKMKEFLNTIN